MGVDCIVPSHPVRGSWQSPRRALLGPWTVANTGIILIPNTQSKYKYCRNWSNWLHANTLELPLLAKVGGKSVFAGAEGQFFCCFLLLNLKSEF